MPARSSVSEKKILLTKPFKDRQSWHCQFMNTRSLCRTVYKMILERHLYFVNFEAWLMHHQLSMPFFPTKFSVFFLSMIQFINRNLVVYFTILWKKKFDKDYDFRKLNFFGFDDDLAFQKHKSTFPEFPINNWDHREI